MQQQSYAAAAPGGGQQPAAQAPAASGGFPVFATVPPPALSAASGNNNNSGAAAGMSGAMMAMSGQQGAAAAAAAGLHTQRTSLDLMPHHQHHHSRHSHHHHHHHHHRSHHHHQQPAPSGAPSTPGMPLIAFSATGRTPNSQSKEEEDVQHVRWSVELVMILVRNINQDRVIIQSLIQNELSKTKQQGEVRDSTIYQYINRIKRWAKGVYEADVRAYGIARRELQQRDRRLTDEEEQLKADFMQALKKEFKSMSFNSSQILEIINLGKTLKDAEERGEMKAERRKSSHHHHHHHHALSIGPSTRGLNSFVDDASSKRRKLVSENGSASDVGLDTNAIASLVNDTVKESITEYTKTTAKAIQDMTQTIVGAVEKIASIQSKIEQMWIERDAREREERNRQREEDRKLLSRLAELKGVSSFGVEESD